jgi:hypothetical protein
MYPFVPFMSSAGSRHRMNWDLAVEKNHEALKRILAMLVAMIGMATGSGGSKDDDPFTLPRHLHRFVLRLLRPAESATRRLIIIAARGLTVKLPKPRVFKPKPAPEPSTIYVLDRVKGSMVSVPIVMPEPVSIPVPPHRTKRTSAPAFPLFDPFKRFGARRRYAKPAAMPSIRLLADSDPIVPQFRQPEPVPPAPPLPMPDDPLDAARIHRRLEVLGRALNDLPGQAQRFARWQARRDAVLAAERIRTGDGEGVKGQDGEGVDWEELGVTPEALALIRRRKDYPAQPTIISQHPKPRRFHRISLMRPGRPPGWRRKPDHEVHEVLNELHGLAVWASERRDSS